MSGAQDEAHLAELKKKRSCRIFSFDEADLDQLLDMESRHQSMVDGASQRVPRPPTGIAVPPRNPTVTSTQSTVLADYGTVRRQAPLNSAHSSTTSLSSENRRAPGIRYPSVSVDSHARSASPLHVLSSGGATIDRLREENARLRLRAEEITSDSNRRVEMHVAEIRMLKEETRRLRGSMGLLEEERNKAHKLAHEWNKFARYSSDLVKQEVRSYDAKLREAHARIRRLREENEELRQICLYLDEQRHATSTASRRLSARSEESDDQGCGSSDHSMEGGREEGAERGYCLQKEDSLRRICMREGGEAGEEKGGAGGEQGLPNDRLLSYIHSLESRIKHLELTTTSGGGGGCGDSWRSSLSPDDLTVMEQREWEGGRGGGGERDERAAMGASTSTMTSSGTTFCSSEMDEQDLLMLSMTSTSSLMTSSSIGSGGGGGGVYVDGTEGGYATHLEVRTLAPIEEERKDDLSQSTTTTEGGGRGGREEKRLSAEVAQSALLPPCMEPITSTTIGMGRYRVESRLSLDSGCGLRMGDEAAGLYTMEAREPRTVSEAVDALRAREQRQLAERKSGRWTSNERKYLPTL